MIVTFAAFVYCTYITVIVIYCMLCHWLVYIITGICINCTLISLYIYTLAILQLRYNSLCLYTYTLHKSLRLGFDR